METRNVEGMVTVILTAKNKRKKMTATTNKQ